MNGIVLPLNVGPLAKLADDSGRQRYALGGVRVVDGNGCYRLEACDGKQLAVLRGNYDNDEGPSECRDFIVPAKDWMDVLSSAKRKVGKEDPFKNPLVLGADEHSYTFSLAGQDANLNTTGGLVEGRWPPTDQTLPKGPPLFSVRLGPKFLIGLMQLAHSLGLTSVDVLFYGPNQPIGFSGRNKPNRRNGQGQYLDCILMPMTPEPQPARAEQPYAPPEYRATSTQPAPEEEPPGEDVPTEVESEEEPGQNGTGTNGEAH